MKITPNSAPPLWMTNTEGSPDTRPGFKEVMKEKIKNVNELQLQAHTAMEDLSTGKTSNLHETMIAMQKAEVSFKMLMQVRSKIVSAYQEIMRMQV